MLLKHIKFMITKKAMWSGILKKLFMVLLVNILIFFIFESFNNYMVNINATSEKVYNLNLALYFFACILIILLGYLKAKEIIKSPKITYFKILGFTKKELLMVFLMPITISSIFFLMCSLIINSYLNLPLLNYFIIFINIFCTQFILIFLKANVKRYMVTIFKVLVFGLFFYIFLTADYSSITYNNDKTNFLANAVFVIVNLLFCIGQSPIIRFFMNTSSTFSFNNVLCIFSIMVSSILIFSKRCFSIIESEQYSNNAVKKIGLLGRLKKYLLWKSKYTAQLVKDFCYYRKTISFIVLCFFNIIIGVLSLKIQPFNLIFFAVLIFFISWMNSAVILDLYNLDINSKFVYKLYGLKNIEIMKLKVFNGVIISFLPILLILSINLIINNINVWSYLLILIFSLLYVILESITYSFAINLYVPSWNGIVSLQPLILLSLIPISIPFTLSFFIFKLRKRSRQNVKSK